MKHATKTIIKTMRPQDRLALFKFDDNCTNILPFTCMDDASKTRASTIVDNLNVSGSTNVENAISTAMKYMEANKNSRHNPQILFFTDGCNNCGNTEQIVPNLLNLKDN